MTIEELKASFEKYEAITEWFRKNHPKAASYTIAFRDGVAACRRNEIERLKSS